MCKKHFPVDTIIRFKAGHTGFEESLEKLRDQGKFFHYAWWSTHSENLILWQIEDQVVAVAIMYGDSGIMTFEVRERLRGLGLGGRLIKELQRDTPDLYLEGYPDGPNATHFWWKLGLIRECHCPRTH